jgi:steroid 5-alpha reductase family enzyme
MLSRLLRRNDIADLLWGSGIMLLSVSVAFLTGDAPLNLIQWSTISLVSLWGLRLTLFLAVRNLPEPETTPPTTPPPAQE